MHMLLDRPPVPVTKPRGRIRTPKRQDDDLEGQKVIDRLCHMECDEQTGWHLLIFEDEASRPEEVPRWVLPSEQLEEMEKCLRLSPSAAFRVSGQTTVYDGRAYIFLTKATVLPSGAAHRPPSTKPSATAPADGAAEPDSRPVTSDDIARRLLVDKPGKPIAVPAGPQATRATPAASVAPAGDRTILPAGPGQIVADRLVRVLPTGTGRWLKVAFESDNTLREPPLRILPCRYLQKLDRLATHKAFRRLRFRISGEITQYKGRSYVLLRKLLPEREMGQF